MENSINKTKVIAIIIIALVVIAGITLGIIFLGGGSGEDYSKAGSISKTESEFEPLKIADIELKYDEERNETILNFSIENKTSEKLEDKTIKIHLLNENEELISALTTDVSVIDGNGSYPVNIVLAGNIQGIKKIKLVNPEKEAKANEPEENNEEVNE